VLSTFCSLVATEWRRDLLCLESDHLGLRRRGAPSQQQGERHAIARPSGVREADERSEKVKITGLTQHFD
jgi:hypothetical protein